MAASKASATTARPQSGGKKRGPGLLLLVLAMPVALLLLPTTLVLLAGMIPTLVARVVDPTPGRYFTITVGALNFAGSLWFIHLLWSAGQDFSNVAPTLGDMFGWLAALIGAGCGWVIYWVMPIIARSIATARSNARLARLRKAQEDLVEQWGEPVRGSAGTPS